MFPLFCFLKEFGKIESICSWVVGELTCKTIEAWSFIVGRFLTTDLTLFIVIKPFRFSIPAWVIFGNLYFSSYLPISSKFSIYFYKFAHNILLKNICNLCHICDLAPF